MPAKPRALRIAEPSCRHCAYCDLPLGALIVHPEGPCRDALLTRLRKLEAQPGAASPWQRALTRLKGV